MAAVTFTKVRTQFEDGTVAVFDLDLVIADGELVVLLGPSGCGKSTALRMIAGLEQISSGELTIGDQRVNDVPPADRDVAMVFQNYALYPHMSVRENMGFALEMSQLDKDEIRRRVENAAHVLDLTEHLDRRPKLLSGAQRQRVALGRAIVRQPGVFLLDEPLANLDAKLRGSLQASIFELQHQLGTTMVYATHDRSEAVALGDRIGVLRNGGLQQIDRPEDLYAQPANLFVARCLGAPPINLVEATLEPGAGDGPVVRFGEHSLVLDAACVARHPRIAGFLGRQVIVGLRPEHLELDGASAAAREPHLDVVVDKSEVVGSQTDVSVLIGGLPVAIEGISRGDDAGGADAGNQFTARIDGVVRLGHGAHVSLVVRTRDAHLFDPATGLPLR